MYYFRLNYKFYISKQSNTYIYNRLGVCYIQFNKKQLNFDEEEEKLLIILKTYDLWFFKSVSNRRDMQMIKEIDEKIKKYRNNKVLRETLENKISSIEGALNNKEDELKVLEKNLIKEEKDVERLKSFS